MRSATVPTVTRLPWVAASMVASVSSAMPCSLKRWMQVRQASGSSSWDLREDMIDGQVRELTDPMLENGRLLEVSQQAGFDC